MKGILGDSLRVGWRRRRNRHFCAKRKDWKRSSRDRLRKQVVRSSHSIPSSTKNYWCTASSASSGSFHAASLSACAVVVLLLQKVRSNTGGVHLIQGSKIRVRLPAINLCRDRSANLKCKRECKICVGIAALTCGVQQGGRRTSIELNRETTLGTLDAHAARFKHTLYSACVARAQGDNLPYSGGGEYRT